MEEKERKREEGKEGVERIEGRRRREGMVC